MKTERKRNSAFDLARFVAAVFIIGVHTHPLRPLGSMMEFISHDIVFRLAVPFFALTTGYFLAPVLRNKDGFVSESGKILALRIMKLIKIYFVWSMIYLILDIPHWIETGWFSYKAFIDYGIGAVLIGSHYHLWYILNLIYALLLLALYAKLFRHSRRYILLSAALYLLFILWYSYIFLLSDRIKPVFSRIFDKTPLGWSGLLLFPLILLGMWIHEKRSTRYPGLCFLICFSALVTEVFLLREVGAERFSYVILTYPTAWFLFETLLRFKLPYRPAYYYLGKMSLLMYCFHPIIAEFLAKEKLGDFAVFLITLSSSCLFSFFAVKLQEKIKSAGFLLLDKKSEQ